MLQQKVTVSGNETFIETVATFNPCQQGSATAATNEVSVTVPANEVWKMCNAQLEYVSDGTAGNRRITIESKDADGAQVMHITAGATQPASQTYHYKYMGGVYRETAFISGDIQVPIPNCWYLKPGYTLRIFDATGVSAGDTVALKYQVERFVV